MTQGTMVSALLRARLGDTAMSWMMNAIQRRNAGDAVTPERLETYIDRCLLPGRKAYFGEPPLDQPDIAGIPGGGFRLRWASPLPSGFPENDRVCVDLRTGGNSRSAPTLLILHALMSASDIGYTRLASRLNCHGWNACFLHLPYHYSRRPRGRLRGELAISSNLVRTGETLRQSVLEIRQLCQWLESQGVSRIAVWSTSYGAWIGALAATVIGNLDFIVLMTPILDVDHAIWEAPVSVSIRRQLVARGVTRAAVSRHYPLSSPLHATPSCANSRILVAAGQYDTIAPASHARELNRIWSDSHLIIRPQGHFGYTLARDCWEFVLSRKWLQ